jgi:hypothetical protein
VYQTGGTVATTDASSAPIDECPYCHAPIRTETREAIGILYGIYEFPKQTFARALVVETGKHYSDTECVLGALTYALDVTIGGLAEAARHYGVCDG